MEPLRYVENPKLQLETPVDAARLSFSPTGLYLVAACPGTITVYQTSAKAKLFATIQCTLQDDENLPPCISWFSCDTFCMVLTHQGVGRLRVIQLAQSDKVWLECGSFVFTAKYPITLAAVHPDPQRRLIALCHGSQAHLWSFSGDFSTFFPTDGQNEPTRFPPPKETSIVSLTWLDQTSLLVISYAEFGASIWDIVSPSTSPTRQVRIQGTDLFGAIATGDRYVALEGEAGPQLYSISTSVGNQMALALTENFRRTATFAHGGTALLYAAGNIATLHDLASDQDMELHFVADADEILSVSECYDTHTDTFKVALISSSGSLQSWITVPKHRSLAPSNPSPGPASPTQPATLTLVVLITIVMCLIAMVYYRKDLLIGRFFARR
ncbi:hypothetical protein ONZ45_g9500 [Pleurotus djamor]|nr:hypothetical protein ONZ45_g9500 [Pleurotus djamor]